MPDKTPDQMTPAEQHDADLLTISNHLSYFADEFGGSDQVIHSEVSEAMEGHRKGLPDDHLPGRPMIEVELADAIIRIGDLAGALGLDVAGAVREKLAYNRDRADHKKANRRAPGGKSY